MKRLGESVEIVEQRNDGRDLDNLGSTPVTREFLVHPIRSGAPGGGDRLSESYRRTITGRETFEVPSPHRLDQRIGRAQPPCQGGMGRQSILATVDLRDPYR